MGALTLPQRRINPATTGGMWRCRVPQQAPIEEVVTVSEQDELAELQEHARTLEEEVLALRRRLQDAPKRVRTLEERLLETKGQLSQAVSQNEKLTYTLREARDHIAALREEVDKLTQPPSAYGTLLGHNDDGTVDVFTGGRKVRVAVHPELSDEPLDRGRRGRAQRVAQRGAGAQRRAHRRGRHLQGAPRRHPRADRRAAPTRSGSWSCSTSCAT